MRKRTTSPLCSKPLNMCPSLLMVSVVIRCQLWGQRTPALPGDLGERSPPAVLGSHLSLLYACLTQLTDRRCRHIGND